MIVHPDKDLKRAVFKSYFTIHFIPPAILAVGLIILGHNNKKRKRTSIDRYTFKLLKIK
jgi:hypothetical protein